jgi:uncharacterized protein YndB with AHSA1/START domain
VTNKRISLERTFEADVADVWDLWTTKDGIESWWGPDGFRVEVIELDLRAGGTCRYAMIADAAPQIEFMKKAGMPLRTISTITYREVAPHTRLAYVHDVDFVQGVEPYTVEHVVTLRVEGPRVHMTLTFDAMHAPEWTERARMGWEQELGKLARRLGR